MTTAVYSITGRELRNKQFPFHLSGGGARRQQRQPVRFHLGIHDVG